MTTTEQERERKMITGYGKGWQEPKASGRIARLRQIMREPATTTAYYTAATVCVVFIWAVTLLS